MRNHCGFIAASLFAGLMLSSPAHASIKWSYEASSTTVYNTNNSDKTSALFFEGAKNDLEGTSGIIMYRLLSLWDPLNQGLSDSDGPDSFDGVNSKYSLVVTFKDDKSGQTGSLTWDGTFKGKNFTQFSFSADKTPFNWTSPMQQKITLGDNVSGFNDYVVEVLFATPPGAPGDPGGAIYAEVKVDPQDDGGNANPNETPEPSTLLIGLFGLPGLVWLRRRS